MLKLIRNRAALVLAGLVAALCPMLMAPSGGIPPVLTLRQINVTAGATAATSLLQPAADATLYSILGRNQAGPGLQCRWDSATANRQCVFGIYDNGGVFSANFSPTSNGVAGESGRVLGDAAGTAARSYFGIYDNAGARQGYFGKTVNGTGDLFWESDGGDLKLIPLTTTGRARISVDGGATFSEVARIQSGTYTGTFNADCTTSPTVTVHYEVVGTLVTLEIPTQSCTSNATSFTLSGGPAVVSPTTSCGYMSPVGLMQDNGAGVAAEACMSSAGQITFSKITAGFGLGNWTASGTKGIGDTTRGVVMHYSTD